MLAPDEADINETKATETEEPALPTTNVLDEDKLKQMKDDLLCNLQAELKNISAENKSDTNANSGILYKKHIDVLQEQVIIERVKLSRIIRSFGN